MAFKKVLGVLPARYASTRLPGKPLLDIAGKPMIQHVYERALSAKLLDECVVATDDARIFNAVRAFGGSVQMTAQTHPNGSSRVAEVAMKSDATHILNIQGDEPLLDPRALDELISAMVQDEKVLSATLCTPILDESNAHNPNVVKVVRALSGNALYFSRSLIPFARNTENRTVWEHLGVYAFTRDFLQIFISLEETPLSVAESLEQLKVLEHGYAMKVIPTLFPPQGPNVNAPEDLETVRQLMAGMV